MSHLSNVYLVWWSPEKGSDPPLVSRVRECLSASGFDPARAPDVPITTAFRRAVKAFECAASDTAAARKVSVWSDKKSDPPITRAQLEELTPDGDRLSRKRVASWVLRGELVDCLPVDGRDYLPLDLAAVQSVYTPGDTSAVIREIFAQDGSGSYALKPQGHIYVVPVQSATFLDRLRSACAGFGIRLVHATLPDESGQRAEVSRAIGEAFAAEIDGHKTAIDGYTADTRLGILENRRESIRATDSALTRVRQLLGDPGYGLARDSMRALLVRLGALEAHISAAQTAAADESAAAAQGVGGRRVVLSS